MISEDLHSTQVMKAVVNDYLVMRLLRYGQQFTRNVVQKNNIGKRQQLNKLILFKGL